MPKGELHPPGTDPATATVTLWTLGLLWSGPCGSASPPTRAQCDHSAVIREQDAPFTSLPPTKIRSRKDLALGIDLRQP